MPKGVLVPLWIATSLGMTAVILGMFGIWLPAGLVMVPTVIAFLWLGLALRDAQIDEDVDGQHPGPGEP